MANVAVRMPISQFIAPVISAKNGNRIFLRVMDSRLRWDDKAKDSVVFVLCPFVLPLSPLIKAACRSGSRIG
jgi:hypothetical protein